MAGYDTGWQLPEQRADQAARDQGELAAADQGEPTAADHGELAARDMGEHAAADDEATSYRRELDTFLREADERRRSGGGAGAMARAAAPDLAAAHADAASEAGMSAGAFLDASPAERGDPPGAYPGPECLGPHEVDALVRGRGLDDARVAHVAECGRCATLLHAVDPATTRARAATERALDGVYSALDRRDDDPAAPGASMPGGWRGVIALAAIGFGIAAALRRRTTIHVYDE